MPRMRQREVQELEVPAGDELLTVREVSQLLRVDTTTCRRWIKEGTLEAVALPSAGKKQAYRIKREVIDTLTTPRRLEGSHA